MYPVAGIPRPLWNNVLLSIPPGQFLRFYEARRTTEPVAVWILLIVEYVFLFHEARRV